MEQRPTNRRAATRPDPLAADLGPGLVLHLDPDVLEANGATFSGDPKRRVQEQHFFLCLRHGDGAGDWLPLFTRPGAKRSRLAAGGRTGHDKWTKGTSYYHPDQVWTATDAAIKAAAMAARDQSTPRSRNRLAPAAMPSLPKPEP